MKTITNAVFNVKEFTVNTLLKHTTEMSSWIGGGHTVDTDPTNRGWRMWNIAGVEGKRYECVLVGRRGMVGCFTARLNDEGDMCIVEFKFDKTEHVREWIVNDNNEHGCEPDCIRDMDHHPGWALSIIAEIEAMDSDLNKEVK